MGVFALLVIGLIFSGVQIWSAPPAKKASVSSEKTYTLTEKQLNVLVDQRMAQVMVQDGISLDKKIQESRNWHTVIYENVEYHIYTGPGQIMPMRWIITSQPPKK